MALRSRLSTVIAIRVVIGTLLLGSAILIALTKPGRFPIAPFFSLIALTYTLSVLYTVTLRWVDRRPWLVDLQFGADAVLVSAFLAITGGVTSYFTSLYVLPVIAASTIRFRRGAVQVAALSAGLYVLLVAVQYTTGLPASWSAPSYPDLPGPRMAGYTLVINLSGFIAVALLAGSLAESLRSAGARLERASHQIEDLRAFNEYVIDSLVSGLMTTDAGCRILTFNRAASAITSVAVAQAIGADAREILQLPDDFRSGLHGLADTHSLRAEFGYRTGAGRTIDLGLAATRFAFGSGPGGYLFTFQDVTTVKRLERDARLQQRLAAVGEMAAGIAHEIRNPLAAMSGSLQLLREELPLSDEQAQLMDIVLRESDRLNSTIRSFLAYAKPQRLAPSRLNLAAVIRDAAQLLRNSADVSEAHQVQVDTPADPVWIEADEHQMRQIVWNLATNGLRSMSVGGRLRLAAAVEDTGSGREAVLVVEDQGCGIPPDQLDHIFQPFHSSFRKGTGLGLAIVHRLVSDHRGTIQVASIVGAGTTVRVRLPLQQPAPVEAATV